MVFSHHQTYHQLASRRLPPKELRAVPNPGFLHPTRTISPMPTTAFPQSQLCSPSRLPTSALRSASSLFRAAHTLQYSKTLQAEADKLKARSTELKGATTENLVRAFDAETADLGVKGIVSDSKRHVFDAAVLMAMRLISTAFAMYVPVLVFSNSNNRNYGVREFLVSVGLEATILLLYHRINVFERIVSSDSNHIESEIKAKSTQLNSV